jgi:hypothetical protein
VLAKLPAAVHAGARNGPRSETRSGPREGKGVAFRLLHRAGGDATLGRPAEILYTQLSFAGSYDSFLPWLPHPRRGRRPVP